MASAQVNLEGTWWYNEGRSFYKIFLSDNQMFYQQVLAQGKEIVGQLNPIGDKEWEGTLNNQATINISISGQNLKSKYRRAGESEFRPATVAKRGPDAAGVQQQKAAPSNAAPEQRIAEDGKLHTFDEFSFFYREKAAEEWEKAQFRGAQMEMTGDLQAFMAAKGKGKGGSRGNKGKGKGKLRQLAPAHQVSPFSMSAQVRKTLLSAIITSDAEYDAPLMASSSMSHRLMEALPAANVQKPAYFDRLTGMPLVQRIHKKDIEGVQVDLARKKKHDPKKTITPVPAVRLMPGLGHPLSYNEEQMMRLFTADPRGSAYNLANGQRSPYCLTAKQARSVAMMICKRHEVLRSAYKFDANNNPKRTVEKDFVGKSFELCLNDELSANLMLGLDSQTGHQLGLVGCRFMSNCSATGMAHFAVNIHHILADADGLGLYFQEAFALQDAMSNGLSEEAALARMPPLPVSFVDFAYWQKSLAAQGILTLDLNYWVTGIIAAQPPLLLDLPIDIPRPRVWAAIGASVKCFFDQEWLTPLQKISGKATPFAVTFTSFAITLARMSGEKVVNVAVPFALRSTAEVMGLLGNFLNMLPVRVEYDGVETYKSVLERVAVSAINVQKYSLAPFITMVDAMAKQYPIQDPSRNPVYATMIDLVPNESEEPSSGLSGVLDMFIFVNTRGGGNVWSTDGVYNTMILQAQSVRTFLLHMQAMAFWAARSGSESVPKALMNRQEVYASGDPSVELVQMKFTQGFLPHIVSLSNGLEKEGQSVEYYSARSSRRFKRHGGLEVMADYPPLAFKDLRPPWMPAPPPKPALPAPKAVAPITKEEKDEAALKAQAEAEEAKKDLARRKLRNYEVACRWAKQQRMNEVIPFQDEYSQQEWHAEPEYEEVWEENEDHWQQN
mmetsp:Transcript_32311/g.72967  ORF Transcript_32311/g.72967 Transcript_32311/m.72967 type:complete len:895 (+) Transcript_32311:82-2766(+)